MFNTLKTDDTIETSGDSLGGTKNVVLDSNIYPMTIKLAYGTYSKGKALALNLVLETEDKKLLKQQLWLTSGEAKGCLNYYMAKDPNTGKNTLKKYLPGFEMANSLCLMVLEKAISEVTTEEKTIMLYDFTAKSEVPTAVNMITELLGKQVFAGVTKQIVNKRVKHPGTGEYVAITETREENEIDKFFHYPSGLTITEAKAKAEPKFKEQWAKKWVGEIKDKTTDDAIPDPTKETNGTAPTTPAASRAGASLFGNKAA